MEGSINDITLVLVLQYIRYSLVVVVLSLLNRCVPPCLREKGIALSESMYRCKYFGNFCTLFQHSTFHCRFSDFFSGLYFIKYIFLLMYLIYKKIQSKICKVKKGMDGCVDEQSFALSTLYAGFKNLANFFQKRFFHNVSHIFHSIYKRLIKYYI